ncbi:Bystin [Spironucleus salmonicida]|uniref:Bystin n=1 Tax=Spironucleus salmonicida TaxID=348837 RepID=V6LMX8_9EUKA|nr:Bystin [Spironucleus salmonicida]|eukprot:EST45985.1 Bystin [Spironucleus salmonicida]
MGKPDQKHKKTLVNEIRGINLKKKTHKDKTNVDDLKLMVDEDIILNVSEQSLKLNANQPKPVINKKAADFFQVVDMEKLDIFDQVDVLDDEALIQNVINSAPTSPAEVLQSLTPVFQQLSIVFRDYRSGSLPKLMRSLPSSNLWLQLMKLTNPLEWSPNATKELTRLFISMLPEKEAFFYIKDLLMPRVRQDLLLKQKLSLQVFESLVKSTYKPLAFLKGCVLEVIQADDSAGLVRAVGSVIKRCSLPRMSVISFIQVLTEADPNGASLAFLATLLSKNYSLTPQNLDSVFNYIMKYTGAITNLVFYDLILIFVKSYGNSLSGEQQVTLYEKMKQFKHQGGISEEILRIIKQCSIQNKQKQLMTFGQDDIII